MHSRGTWCAASAATVPGPVAAALTDTGHAAASGRAAKNRATAFRNAIPCPATHRATPPAPKLSSMPPRARNGMITKLETGSVIRLAASP